MIFMNLGISVIGPFMKSLAYTPDILKSVLEEEDIYGNSGY